MRSTKIAIIILSSFFLPLISNAGWFSKPKNYEECVLEKMKEQDRYMLPTARKACEKLFPYEKVLADYKDNIEIEWYSDDSKLHLMIKKNYGEYEITKYKAGFSTKSCDDLKNSSDYTLTETFFFSDAGGKASVPVSGADKFKCMRTVTIWGRMRK